MDGHRVNQALARIEGAIARIEAASANRGASAQGGEDSLIQENILQENRALREAVQTSLRDLDAVIGKLGS